MARVLVVEDNAINQKVVAAMLRRFGCDVDVAWDGREAVERVQGIRYDIVFMDCQMPVMDGFQATAAIRAGPRRDVPIVAVTAHALPGDREKCLAAGMDDYITKPVKQERLLEVFRRWSDAQAA